MRSRKSLSTILEESKSTDASLSTNSSNYRRENENCTVEQRCTKEKLQIGLPAPGNPSCSSKLPASSLSEPGKRHTILKGTSREFKIPPRATILRDSSLREKLIFHLSATKQPLFPAVFSQPSTKSETSCVVVTGFGLRNIGSLQEILNLEKQKKMLRQLYRPQVEGCSSNSTSSKSTSSDSKVSTSLISQSSSHGAQATYDLTSTQSGYKKLSYLMGLPEIEEEEEEDVRVKSEHSKSSQKTERASVFVPTTESCRMAQTYLRIHKIFEFFQFIACHLLSNLPDDPITFILELLDECLVYRSGLMKPPSVFRRRHIEAVYKMMDKMGTGIDLKQYKAGMRTLGICSFDKAPNIGPDGLINKQDFLQDAYENVRHALDDMIRRHWLRKAPLTPPPRTPTPQLSSSYSSIDSDAISNQFRKSRLFLT